jgi:hypothetical protein
VSERQQILVPGTHATLALLQTDSEPDPRNLQWLVATGRPCGFPRYFARLRNQLASYQFFPLLNRGAARAFRSSRAEMARPKPAPPTRVSAADQGLPPQRIPLSQSAMAEHDPKQKNASF